LNLTINNKTHPVRIIDTSGQDAIEDGDGFIVTFSLDSARSFHKAKELVDLVKEIKGYKDVTGRGHPCCIGEK